MTSLNTYLRSKPQGQAGGANGAVTFSPRRDMLDAMAGAIAAVAASVKRLPADPLAVGELLEQQFLLFGGTGIVTFARAVIDMAIWDGLARSLGQPLWRLLGGAPGQIKAYDSSGLGISTPQAVVSEAENMQARGFDCVKVRLGYATVAQDLAVLDALRRRFGDRLKVMVDFNQALAFDDALIRCQALDACDLVWIEEPLNAQDLEGAARLAAQISTPLQLGENLFSIVEVTRSLGLSSSKYLMPDVQKIGGVTAWLAAADAAQIRGVPVSSHLFPHQSLHLLAAAPNRHYLEYVDWMDAVFTPLKVEKGGWINLPEAPGSGLELRAGAMAKFAV